MIAMKKYTEPTMEELVLEAEDTITASGGDAQTANFDLGNDYATAGKTELNPEEWAAWE